MGGKIIREAGTQRDRRQTITDQDHPRPLR
jgi:hypothetical protein